MSNLEAPRQHRFVHSPAQSHCSWFLPTNLICVHDHPLWTVKCEFHKEQTEDSIDEMASGSRSASHLSNDDDDDAVECIGVKPPENLVVDLLSLDSSAKSSTPLIGQPSSQKKPSDLTSVQDLSVNLSPGEDSPGVDSTHQKHSGAANHGCIHHDDSLSSSSGLDIKTSSDSDAKMCTAAKCKRKLPVRSLTLMTHQSILIWMQSCTLPRSHRSKLPLQSSTLMMHQSVIHSNALQTQSRIVSPCPELTPGLLVVDDVLWLTALAMVCLYLIGQTRAKQLSLAPFSFGPSRTSTEREQQCQQIDFYQSLRIGSTVKFGT